MADFQIHLVLPCHDRTPYNLGQAFSARHSSWASPGRVLMFEAMLSGFVFRYTNHALSSESLSLSDDSFDPTTGHRSLTWWGMPSTHTDCGLIISVICLILSLSVHLLCGVLTNTVTNSVFSLCVARSYCDISGPKL